MRDNGASIALAITKYAVRPENPAGVAAGEAA
jgi:hypothetical protein